MGDEVVDLDDKRVLDLGQELSFGDRRSQRVGVTGVEQTLQDDPAVGHVTVAREIDPAEAAVREASGDLVLPADQITGGQLGDEGEGVAALWAETFGAPGLPVA